MFTAKTLFRSTRVAATMAALALVTRPLVAAEIKLPTETARFAESPLPGYQLASTICMTCHSADYVRMQPPSLNRTYWKAAVTKMQKAFGATTIPDAAVDPIVDYIVKTYGNERTASMDAKAAPTKPAPTKR